MLPIYNEDCITGASKYFDAETMDLIICDPPFGIEESEFQKHYKRNSSNVIPGYVEAPDDYGDWTYAWMYEAKRILKNNGSMYVFSGWSNLYDVLAAVKKLNLATINHIIWNYNFGPNTRNKYVTSHYHVLYLSKIKAKPTFNTHCRFGPIEKDEHGKAQLYHDLEDVFHINRENHPNQMKNTNKLPNELIEKLVLYSSNPGDIVCDFFMGNFTTAFVSYKLGRQISGFELNAKTYNYYLPLLERVEFGSDLPNLRKVPIDSPPNQGKTITKEESDAIFTEYNNLIGTMKKKDAKNTLCERYGRGWFSITNVIDEKLGKGKCGSSN